MTLPVSGPLRKAAQRYGAAMHKAGQEEVRQSGYQQRADELVDEAWAALEAALQVSREHAEPSEVAIEAAMATHVQIWATFSKRPPSEEYAKEAATLAMTKALAAAYAIDFPARQDSAHAEDATGVQVDNRPRPVADAVTGGLKTGEREAATPTFSRPAESLAVPADVERLIEEYGHAERLDGVYGSPTTEETFAAKARLLAAWKEKNQ